MNVEPIEATLERERSALGAAILDRIGQQAEIMSAKLCEHDFVSSLRRAVFATVRRLVERGDVPLDYGARWSPRS